VTSGALAPGLTPGEALAEPIALFLREVEDPIEQMQEPMRDGGPSVQVVPYGVVMDTYAAGQIPLGRDVPLGRKHPGLAAELR